MDAVSLDSESVSSFGDEDEKDDDSELEASLSQFQEEQRTGYIADMCT